MLNGAIDHSFSSSAEVLFDTSAFQPELTTDDSDEFIAGDSVSPLNIARIIHKFGAASLPFEAQLRYGGRIQRLFYRIQEATARSGLGMRFLQTVLTTALENDTKAMRFVVAFDQQHPMAMMRQYPTPIAGEMDEKVGKPASKRLETADVEKYLRRLKALAKDHASATTAKQKKATFALYREHFMCCEFTPRGRYALYEYIETASKEAQQLLDANLSSQVKLSDKALNAASARDRLAEISQRANLERNEVARREKHKAFVAQYGRDPQDVIALFKKISLIERIRQRYRQAMTEHFYPLTMHHSHRSGTRKLMTWDDSFQNGIVTIMESIDSYKPWHCASFVTYSYHTLMHMQSYKPMLEAEPVTYTQNVKPIRIHNKLRRIEARLANVLMRQPAMREIREAVIKEFGDDSAMQYRNVLGLERLSEVDNIESDCDCEVEASACTEEVQDRIRNALTMLPARTAEVLRLRYGINPDNKQCSLHEVAQLLGISYERVRQIEVEGLNLLRHSKPQLKELL